MVSALPADGQANATQALMEPILAPLQSRLQQAQPNGAGANQPAPDDAEYVGAFVDRLGVIFK